MEDAQGKQQNTEKVAVLTPIAQSKRIDALDILRGIALVGILLMNIEWFNRPLTNLIGFDHSLTGIDHAAGWLIRCFVEGKFYKLFALLFGMGFAVMLLRAKEVGRPFGAWFTRRMIALWVLGIIHMVFLWGGDILHDYALAGLMLLLWVYILQKPNFQQYDNPRSYLKLAAIWLFLPVFFSIVGGIGAGVFMDHKSTLATWDEEQEIAIAVAMQLELPQEALELITEESIEDNPSLNNDSKASELTPVEEKIKEQVAYQRDAIENEEKETVAFTEGSYWQATQYRLEFLAFMLPFSPLFAFAMLIPIFILGFWFVASKRIINYKDYMPMYTLMRNIGLPLGVFLNVAGVLLLQQPSAEISMVITSIGEMIFFVGQYILTAGYLGLVICMLADEKWHSRLAKFAPMGKMALTNYLMHSVILTSIFYGYAGGQFGLVSRSTQVLIVLVIIVFQMLASRWWLARFRFGPMEWLWRSITYKKLQPMYI